MDRQRDFNFEISDNTLNLRHIKCRLSKYGITNVRIHGNTLYVKIMNPSKAQLDVLNEIVGADDIFGDEFNKAFPKLNKF